MSDELKPDDVLTITVNDLETKYVSRASYDALRAQLREAEARAERAEADAAFHPRAAKLMRKRKNFLVVAEDEPYYINTYLQIKIAETQKGRWTDEDEQCFLTAWKADYDRANEIAAQVRAAHDAGKDGEK